MLIKIADRIKYAREMNGLTQSELAKQMSITRSGVNAWEMGISIPSTEKIAELSRILNISTDYLLGISDEENVSLLGLNEEAKSVIYSMINILREK